MQDILHTVQYYLQAVSNYTLIKNKIFLLTVEDLLLLIITGRPVE